MTKNTAYYKEMFEAMVQNAPVSMYILENQTFSYVNNTFCAMSGYTKEDFASGKMAMHSLVYPEDLPIILERMDSKETEARYRVRILKKDRTTAYAEIHSRKTHMDGKAVIFGTVLDVTEEMLTTMQLNENQERFQSLYDNNPDAVFTFDTEGTFVDVNPGCEELSGYPTDELLQMSFMTLIVAEDLPTALHFFQKAIMGETNRYEVSIKRKDGEVRDLEVTNFPMTFSGKTVGAYGIAKDITVRNAHRKLLEDLVFYDSLTKLPNRKLFEDRLGQFIKLSKAHNNEAAVLFLDLDRFKLINDSFGHSVGDEFLKAVSDRLVQSVGGTATVGRFAGDEFAIFLPNTSRQEAIDLAKQLNFSMTQPVEVKGYSLSASASIGIAFWDSVDENVEEIIKKADTAMYYTKRYGKNHYTVYTSELDPQATYKFALEKDLKSAIQNDELVLHYQPITNLKTGERSAMEALIRWNHPTYGLVPPDHFIPVSEESGQIVAIGKWVLHTACTQNKAWQDEGLPPFKICVNISTIQLQHSGFLQTVEDVLASTGLDPIWLELEVTESILMENTATLKERLANLKALGLSMSIDDFGTGYTSLSYLQQFPFDRVKIDRSFIADITDDLNGKAITSTIISLAHKLNMSVVAEGIEDETQLSYLQEENCDNGQGYFFCRPLPAGAHSFTRK